MPDRTGTEDLVSLALQLIDPDLVDMYGDYPDPSATTALVMRDESVLSVLVDSFMISIMFSSAGPSVLTITRCSGANVLSTDSDVS
jgi:hypothetical protein